MTQPEYVPIVPADRVRPHERLPPPQRWKADRPAEVYTTGRQPVGPTLGRPGPDLGFGLKLAKRFVDRLVLAEGEFPDDVVAGCFAVGTMRSSIYGRAPVIYDMELAYTLWGYLGGAPADLVAFRRPLFQGSAHHYWDQRAIVARVPEETLRLTPAAVRDRLGDWRSLLLAD